MSYVLRGDIPEPFLPSNVTAQLMELLAMTYHVLEHHSIHLCKSYHELELDPQSRYITTFSTHLGQLLYKRLHFEVSSVAEISQEMVKTVITSIKNFLNRSDDILVFNRTNEENNIPLWEVSSQLERAGLTLNVDNSKLEKEELIFFHHIFSRKEMQPDPSKVETLHKTWVPADVAEVRQFLGLASYCTR
ncbi:hypothetical protein NDU88_003418 [Pleurodeles waltl]|uniref:Uncharacterized protein n=1 Tax=Pleurodeles waltl TaxID=8319 RepID=A0AAV7UC11_PLEWA|nr:hypothetical protein NDU88_003418 [Pleurodeles waltl]